MHQAWGALRYTYITCVMQHGMGMLIVLTTSNQNSHAHGNQVEQVDNHSIGIIMDGGRDCNLVRFHNDHVVTITDGGRCVIVGSR